MQSIISSVSVREVEESLCRLSSNYADAYEGVMLRIQAQESQLREIAMKALMWTSWDGRRLTVEELQHALAVRLEDRHFVRSGIVSLDVILSSCTAFLCRGTWTGHSTPASQTSRLKNTSEIRKVAGFRKPASTLQKYISHNLLGLL